MAMAHAAQVNVFFIGVDFNGLTSGALNCSRPRAQFRDDLAVSFARHAAGGDAHHLAHVGHARGAGLGDDGCHFRLDLLFCQRLGQEFSNDRGLGPFLCFEVGASLLSIEVGGFGCVA